MPALANGETFLTLRQFHTLMRHQRIRGSLRNLYRWLDLPKHLLPDELQQLLEPAPSLWYVRCASRRSPAVNHPGIAIPVRFLSLHVQDVCTRLVLHYVEPHAALRTLRSMQATIAQLQQDMHSLTLYVESFYGKDGPNDQRTREHSLTA